MYCKWMNIFEKFKYEMDSFERVTYAKYTDESTWSTLVPEQHQV